MLKGTGEAGGCTRDLVHRFYQEKYQINGGQQNRYVTGSDAVGLTMGTYATKQLPIYQYLHKKGAPQLRHRRPLLPGRQRRLVPQPPVADRRPGAVRRPERRRAGHQTAACNTVLDANGMPASKTYPLYTPTATRRRRRS